MGSRDPVSLWVHVASRLPVEKPAAVKDIGALGLLLVAAGLAWVLTGSWSLTRWSVSSGGSCVPGLTLGSCSTMPARPDTCSAGPAPAL